MYIMTGKKNLLPLLATVLMASCSRPAQIIQIDAHPLGVTAALDATPDSICQAIVDEFRDLVVEKQSPVLGTCATLMEKSRPECELANFAADAIRHAGDQANGTPVDLGITNMGGLRNIFNPGDITVGDVYNMFPFENYLYLLSLDGKQLTTLFGQVAAAGGQCISGAQLVITADGQLVSATIGGKAIDPDTTYRIATINYLAEGNDGLSILAEGTDRRLCEDGVMREVITDYIATFTQRGEPISAPVEGRITLK